MEDKTLDVIMLLLFLQMFSIAVTCGNTFILKPSEKNPGTSFSFVVINLV